MLVILACFVFMIITPQKGLNPLFVLLQTIDRTPGVLSVVVLFFVCLGLYGAMLSTASTQLIAVSHTLYEDVFCRLRKHPLAERLLMTRELGVSRAILVIAAVFSTIMVHLLSRQFSIAEMVFAIYGAQVGLCPLVVAALLLPREKLKGISAWAAVAVSGGFIAGWEAALLGGYTENTNLVFLAPVFSLAVSSLFLAIGMLLRTTEAKYQQ
jgi:Na+/proline symporter